MRKLFYFGMASVDGFINGPNQNDDWIVMDEELHRFINQREQQVGAYLYGRQMYQMMQAYWPTADRQSELDYEVEFSRIWKQIPKVVFSSTLERVEGNASLVRGDVVEAVKRLKAQPAAPGQPGGDLEVGGATLASSLMQAGLIDGFQLYIHPAILGAGTPMFPGLQETGLAQAAKLRLVESHPFRSGVMFLKYER